VSSPQVSASPIPRRAPVLSRRLAWLTAAAFAAVTLAGLPTTTEAKASTSNARIKVEGPLADISTSSLQLTPKFDPSFTDYVLRCQPGINRVVVTMDAPSGDIIQVNRNRGRKLSVTTNLVANQALVIQVTRVYRKDISSDDDDIPESGSVDYWIRCLPPDFPQLKVSNFGTPPPGWYLTGSLSPAPGATGTYAMVLDSNGTPVWYRKSKGQSANVTALSDGSIAWFVNTSAPFGVDPNGAFQDVNLVSQTIRLIRAPLGPTDFHELQSIDRKSVV